MTAQEWLEELQTKAKAATPGPWKIIGRQSVIPCTPDARILLRTSCCLLSKQENAANAAYIVAACNAVPRLVQMLRIAVSIMEGQNARRRDWYGESTSGDPMQLLFTMTEPKE